MQTKLLPGRGLVGTPSANLVRLASALIFAAAIAAVMVNGSRHFSGLAGTNGEPSLILACDRASITAAAQLSTAGEGPRRGAAARRERERSFNACLDAAAARGMHRAP